MQGARIAAVRAFERGGDRFQFQHRVLRGGVLRRNGEKFPDAGRRISKTRWNPLFSCSDSTIRMIPSVSASSCMSQRSRQLKQGSMLAMMSPASATVLLRSMCGTVGVFL